MLYFPLLVVLALDSCAGYHSLTGHARFFSQKVPSSALFDGIDNDVLGIAQSFLSGKLGINTASTLADEVRLVGPASAVNGKSNYLTATKKDTENLLQIMPDYSLGEYSLQIDETNNNIVYAFLRPKGTFSSPVVLGKDVITPTKETIKFPIEHVTLALKSNKVRISFDRCYIVVLISVLLDHSNQSGLCSRSSHWQHWWSEWLRRATVSCWCWTIISDNSSSSCCHPALACAQSQGRSLFLIIPYL